jgi:hypothetical protein
MENASQSAHREWLSKVNGTKIPEITGSKAMPGLEYLPLDGLIVSDNIKSWEHIKQPIIPLAPAENGDEPAEKASHELRTLRAQLNSEAGFLALVQDEQLGGEGKWALSIIKPIELDFSEKQLRAGMEVCYSIGQVLLASSTRAALLAITGKQTV